VSLTFPCSLVFAGSFFPFVLLILLGTNMILKQRIMEKMASFSLSFVSYFAVIFPQTSTYISGSGEYASAAG
jgi:hypothetical protein